MALLPHIEQPVNPGALSSLPYETANPSSIHNQLLRSMRQMRGFDQYLLTIAGSEPKADFLASYAGLNKDDAESEEKLSAALDDLLKTIIEACEANGYPDKDRSILKAAAIRSFKPVLAGAMQVFMEDAAFELAQMRTEGTNAA